MGTRREARDVEEFFDRAGDVATLGIKPAIKALLPKKLVARRRRGDRRNFNRLFKKSRVARQAFKPIASANRASNEALSVMGAVANALDTGSWEQYVEIAGIAGGMVAGIFLLK